MLSWNFPLAIMKRSSDEQALTWTNHDPVHWGIYVLHGLNGSVCLISAITHGTTAMNAQSWYVQNELFWIYITISISNSRNIYAIFLLTWSKWRLYMVQGAWLNLPIWCCVCSGQPRSEPNIHGLEQDCSNSSALAIELLQSCTKPLI